MEDATQEAYCALKMYERGAINDAELRRIYFDLFPHHSTAAADPPNCADPGPKSPWTLKVSHSPTDGARMLHVAVDTSRRTATVMEAIYSLDALIAEAELAA